MNAIHTTEGERVVVALKHTSASDHLTYLDDILRHQEIKLAEWVDDHDRFERLDGDKFDDPISREGIAYAYGCIVGVCDAYEVKVSRMVEIWAFGRAVNGVVTATKPTCGVCNGTQPWCPLNEVRHGE